MCWYSVEIIHTGDLWQQGVCVCVSVVLLEELGVLGLLPVQQVLQVVDEGSLPQDASLSQNWTHKRTQ